jgi:hypothetical protein
MNVWHDVRRIIERTAAHEPDLRSTIFAEDGDLTARATEDPLRATVVTRHIDRLRRCRQNLNPLCLDEQIDHEGAASLTLTVQTMTAMNKQRFRR